MNVTTNNVDSIKKTNNSFILSLIVFVIDFFIVICPGISYLLQVIKFYKTKSSEGFSKFTCFILFIANTLRIFFWFGKKFKITLLLQSLDIVLFQFYLIYLCIKFQENKYLPNLKPKKSLFYHLTHWSDTFNLKKIWKWNIVIEYYKFMFFIIFVLTVICSLINTNFLYNIIGGISAIFEILICGPQIIENFKTKNTKNVSCLMIFLWMLGDTFKFLYNVKYKTPIQMIIGASIQVLSEIIVMIQFFIYKNKVYNYYETPNIISQNKRKGLEGINKLMRNIVNVKLNVDNSGLIKNEKSETENKIKKVKSSDLNDSNKNKEDVHEEKENKRDETIENKENK